MTQKYEFVPGSELEITPGTTLKRIRAVIAIAAHGVAVGDLGGYLESEANLSHEGDAWVGDDAWAFSDGRISGNALISGHAMVGGRARVSGRARISDDAQVGGCAAVSGHESVTMQWSLGTHI